jgi:uroporphyrinogen III methyltransferase/synthase
MVGSGDSSTARNAPLAGRTVIVTRTREQVRSLADPLEALGAEVLAMPVLEIVDPPDTSVIDGAISMLSAYDWVVLTSTNAVDRFLARPAFEGRAVEALADVKLAAVGKATAAHMRALGIEPDLVPDDARAEGLVAAFKDLGVGGGTRVLIPRALRAREVLPDELEAMGVVAQVAPVYQTAPLPGDPEVLSRLQGGTVDCVAFTSGAIAAAFFSAVEMGGLDPQAVMGGVAVASVGPVTTARLTALGFHTDIEAPEATMGALAEAIGAFGSWERRLG